MGYSGFGSGVHSEAAYGDISSRVCLNDAGMRNVPYLAKVVAGVGGFQEVWALVTVAAMSKAAVKHSLALMACEGSVTWNSRIPSPWCSV